MFKDYMHKYLNHYVHCVVNDHDAYGFLREIGEDYIRLFEPDEISVNESEIIETIEGNESLVSWDDVVMVEHRIECPRGACSVEVD